MKILILANNDVGLYKFRKELIEKIVTNNKVFISLPSGPYIEILEKYGCEFINTNVDRRGTNLFKDIKLLSKYIYLLKNIKPDLVLTYTVKPNIYGGLACRLIKTRYFSNITGLGTSIEKEGFMKRLILKLYKYALKDSDCVFFQNESNRRFFIEKNIVKKNSKLIPGSGVNLGQHRFEPYPEDKRTISFLFIGRIMKAKGIDELLKAAKKIKERKPNVEFDIVGSCEEDYLENLTKLNDSGIIHYHGHQDDVHKFIKASHAVILPSYHEGLSNVLLEAASSGRPILASNVNGCKETFDEGVSGIGFDVKSVESLVDALERFLELPYEKKKEMGIAGRKKIEKEFDRNIVVRAYLEEIQRNIGVKKYELI